MIHSFEKNSGAGSASAESQTGGQTRSRRFLLLSTSLLVDRVFRYTQLVPTLASRGDVTVWTTSSADHIAEGESPDIRVAVEPFPKVNAFREFPHNYLRRLNEYVWDFRFRPPSRMSMMKHRRDKQAEYYVRALKPLARILASLRREEWLERNLERLLLTYERSAEADRRIVESRPDVIVSTGPFQFEQPAILNNARKYGIPVLAYIPSWDNISTKNRMVFNYDGYLVWNERSRNELHAFYPATRTRPVHVIGAPQFDVFYQDRFHESREAFCRDQDLDPARSIIVYALGSPNFLNEKHGAFHLAQRVFEGHLGDVQMLVRPHPIHDNAELAEEFDKYAPRVRLQKTKNAGKELNKRTQDVRDVIEWVNTFKHADVVVNMSSTVTIDAARFDRPVVNLDFDPQPGQADQALIKEVNHLWSHFKPIAESGGVWLVNDFSELEKAVIEYLKDPALHRAERKWMVEHVCGFSDANCGERMAEAIFDFVENVGRTN